MEFQISALPADRFAHFRDLSDDELRTEGVRRLVVDEKPGYPCRVSLQDAEVGDVIYAFSFVHLDSDSPYRSSGPIFVREGVKTAYPAPNEVPIMFRHRLLSLRGYDRHDIMIEADTLRGDTLEDAILRMFSNPDVSFLHIHNAMPGCFNCRVDRVGDTD